MKNTEIALSYAKQAKERLHHAREALERGNYPYVVRQCQEAVELMLKAALRLVGVEPPRWRDVGPVLRREAARFPEWFRESIPNSRQVLEEVKERARTLHVRRRGERQPAGRALRQGGR
ncbi:MAG: HEPN domain-containing protein [Thermofilum sp.]